MARHKGAVGTVVGTAKLGAYSMEDTLEIFEREGYVKYKDLDQFFKGCYFEFETDLSEKEFVEKSKKNILRSKKYKQFVNGEVKPCGKCKHIKPLESFSYSVDMLYNKRADCKLCCSEYYGDWRVKNSETERRIRRNYYKNNKEKLNNYRKEWLKDKKGYTSKYVARSNMKKKLKELGVKNLSPQNLDRIIDLKRESGIKLYSNFFEVYRGALND